MNCFRTCFSQIFVEFSFKSVEVLSCFVTAVISVCGVAILLLSVPAVGLWNKTSPVFLGQWRWGADLSVAHGNCFPIFHLKFVYK